MFERRNLIIVRSILRRRSSSGILRNEARAISRGWYQNFSWCVRSLSLALLLSPTRRIWTWVPFVERCLCLSWVGTVDE